MINSQVMNPLLKMTPNFSFAQRLDLFTSLHIEDLLDSYIPGRYLRSAKKNKNYSPCLVSN